MQIWRLITHHENPTGMYQWAEEDGRMAVGWGSIGDLRNSCFTDGAAIGRAIATTYPGLKNNHTGGASLWRFYHELQKGDLVLLSNGAKRIGVCEVTGEYRWASEFDSFGDYQHQRTAVLTDLDPDELWDLFGGRVADGQNQRWTFALCGSMDNGSSPADSQPIYSEGTRYEVLATRVERRPEARRDCIQHHGTRCAVCDLDFGERYGEIGNGFIHVHHLNPVSDSNGVREVDPIKDLVPLCPNCHAMAHRRRPPLKVDELRDLFNRGR